MVSYCPCICPERINRILWFDYMELWVDNVPKNYAGWMSSYSKICNRTVTSSKYTLKVVQVNELKKL